MKVLRRGPTLPHLFGPSSKGGRARSELAARAAEKVVVRDALLRRLDLNIDNDVPLLLRGITYVRPYLLWWHRG